MLVKSSEPIGNVNSNAESTDFFWFYIGVAGGFMFGLLTHSFFALGIVVSCIVWGLYDASK
jgi:hypothetical protein